MSGVGSAGAHWCSGSDPNPDPHPDLGGVERTPLVQEVVAGLEHADQSAWGRVRVTVGVAVRVRV